MDLFFKLGTALGLVDDGEEGRRQWERTGRWAKFLFPVLVVIVAAAWLADVADPDGWSGVLRGWWQRAAATPWWKYAAIGVLAAVFLLAELKKDRKKAD